MWSIPFEEIRRWMFDDALPLWGSAGVDHERGGFREELSLSGGPTDVAFKRVRAQCRQIYVFSHADLLGWRQGAALAEMGYEYLVSKAWMGPDKGWAKRLTATGDVLDPTPDLYDIAFVLFALVWRYRASGDKDALKRAHETLDFVQNHMRPEPGAEPSEGFWHQLPPEGPRLQNPHMHLFEASLAAFEATQDQRFLDQAREIVALFRERLFDGRTLGEYFTRYWRRLDDEQGRTIEPGHQFEWAWILAQYARITGDDTKGEATALVEFAENYGVDTGTHFTFNSIRDDGLKLDGGSRTWPNTERIKGWLGLFELTGRDPRMAVSGSARLLLDRYLAVEPRGSWMDAFDAEGRPAATAAPASTLYHVFLAFTEILRLEPKLGAL
ncbi:MAG TPA: AGE family epimerase/isomerase [Caulobacterales bacterium]|nr:AGE family epimerase/isomerase [Caulobacterales bacterium]